MESQAGRAVGRGFWPPFRDPPSRSQRPEDAHVEIPLGKTSRLVAQLTEPTTGSCPVAWCSSGGVIAALAGMDRAGQAATAGSPTMGSSLNGAIVSRVI